jgi:serine/threonine protein kinase
MRVSVETYGAPPYQTNWGRDAQGVPVFLKIAFSNDPDETWHGKITDGVFRPGDGTEIAIRENSTVARFAGCFPDHEGAERTAAYIKNERAILELLHTANVPRVPTLEPSLCFDGVRTSVGGTHAMFPHTQTVYAARKFQLAVKRIEGADVWSVSDLLSIPKIITIGQKVADTLHAAHEAGVSAHNDINPSNILIETSTGDPYVLDWGVATTDAQKNGVMGTSGFLSLSLLTHKCPISSETDTVSLTKTLMSMLIGSTLYPRIEPGMEKVDFESYLLQFCIDWLTLASRERFDVHGLPILEHWISDEEEPPAFMIRLWTRLHSAPLPFLTLLRTVLEKDQNRANAPRPEDYPLERFDDFQGKLNTCMEVHA